MTLRAPIDAGDADPHIAPKRYATEELPGIGGTIKERPEDFLVDEVPLYEPAGAGEHLYLCVQKRNLSTLELVGIIARHFGVPARAVGFAGLKDKLALTRQVISVHVPGKRPEDFPALLHDRFSILWADMHANKLRRGHLRGNRFSIRIRNVDMTAALRAQRVMDALAAHGVPNRLGEQRFGHLGNNHLIGRAIIREDHEEAIGLLLGPSASRPDMQPAGRELCLQGRYAEALAEFPAWCNSERLALRALARGANPRRAIHALEETVVRYYLSAFQSAVFNALLDERVVDRSFGGLVSGDLAFKHDNRAVFAVTPDVLADPGTGARLEKFEISPSGPMWGAAMMRAGPEIDEREVSALGRLGLTPADLASFEEAHSGMIEGERRPYRVPIIDPQVEGGIDEHGNYVRCVFELPRGAFATVVMREVMKPQTEQAVEE